MVESMPIKSVFLCSLLAVLSKSVRCETALTSGFSDAVVEGLLVAVAHDRFCFDSIVVSRHMNINSPFVYE